MKRLAMLLVLIAPFAVGLALPGASQGNGPSYAADIEPLFAKRCGDCHTGDEPKADLRLESGAGYEQLVNHPSHQVPELLRVKPGDPDHSYLWQKLEGAGEVGKQMPRTLFGSRQLPGDELDLVRRWIATGANP